MYRFSDLPFLFYSRFWCILFLTSAQPEASECRDLHSFGFEFAAGDQVGVHAVVLIDPCNLVKFTEVIDTDEFLIIVFTHESKDRIIPGINSTDRYITVEYAVFHTEMFQLVKYREEFALNSFRTITVLGEIPSEVSSVEVTGIGSFVRIILVGVIVELCNLITAVNDRNTGL